MFSTGIKKFKKSQNMIFGHIGVHWVRSWQKTFRDSRGELLSNNVNIGILAHTGAMFLTGMKTFKKHQSMIFRHIGVYWVRSLQKLTS